MGLSCCKSHWKGVEDQTQNPVELIPCALWWGQLPPPAFHLSWPADLFVLAQNLQSTLSAAPKSELAEQSVGTSSIFGSSSSLSLTTKNKPSQLSSVFATDPPSDPAPTTKEYKDELLSGTWLSGH